jgi:hypothetical protein
MRTPARSPFFLLCLLTVASCELAVVDELDETQSDQRSAIPTEVTYRTVVQADLRPDGIGLSRLRIGRRIPQTAATYEATYRNGGASDVPGRITYDGPRRLTLYPATGDTALARFTWAIDADGYLTLKRDGSSRLPARLRPVSPEQLFTTKTRSVRVSHFVFLDPLFDPGASSGEEWGRRAIKPTATGDLVDVACATTSLAMAGSDGVYVSGVLQYAATLDCVGRFLADPAPTSWSGPARLVLTGTPNTPGVELWFMSPDGSTEVRRWPVVVTRTEGTDGWAANTMTLGGTSITVDSERIPIDLPEGSGG